MKKLLRLLSETESFYVQFKISILVICDFNGLLDPILLKKALVQVAKHHQLLSSRIIEVDKQFYFTDDIAPEIQLQTINDINSEEKQRAIISEELNRPLVSDSSLWRSCLILKEHNNCSLIVTIHHAIADGISVIGLQKEILETYIAINENKSMLNEEVLPVMPPLEDFVPKTINQADLLDFIKRYTERAKTLDALAISPLLPIATKEITPLISFVQSKLNPAQTQELIKKCKLNDTTVHGAICAAHLLAIRKLLKKENQSITLCCHSPIDMRIRLEPPIDSRQLFSAAIGCTSCLPILANTSLWELAKDINANIQNYIESNDIFKGILTFKETRAKFKLPVAIGITNVGVVAMPKLFGAVELVEISFIPAITLPMLTATVTTFSNQLVINYPFVEPYYSEKMIKDLADLALEFLFLLERN